MCDFWISFCIGVCKAGLDGTLKVQFVLLGSLFLFNGEISRGVVVTANDTIQNIRNTLGLCVFKDALQCDVLDSSFNEHHFSVKQSFQGRIILDGGIELLIRRKRQARTGRFEETIAFIAMIISGCDKLLFLCFAGDGDAVVTQVLH